MQLIFEGKTNRILEEERCHPTGVEFPQGFNVTHTRNHWSNDEKVIEHLESVIFPFAEFKRTELGLEEEQKCLLVYDVFRGQCTQKVFD